MAENPSDYDKLQDDRLDELESLITAEYEPPEGAQYSFPIANQGITQDQWQQMMLTTGDGAIITEDSEYSFRLVPHETDPETNQRNTLILKVSQNTGRNEASMAGFYFRQTEDIELPFPAVTSATTYYVTVTYDPRNFKTSPLRIEVFRNELPRQHGQKHIVLRTVRRQASQLLSQATISTLRHYVSPVVTAVTEAGLPEATDVLYGTIGVVRPETAGGKVVPGTGQLLESRGIHGWHNILVGQWEDLHIQTGNGWSGSGAVRPVNGGLDVRFNINYGGDAGRTPESSMIRLPAKYSLKRPFYTTIFTTDGPTNYMVGADSSGHFGRLANVSSRPSWCRGNFFIPDYNLSS